MAKGTAVVSSVPEPEEEDTDLREDLEVDVGGRGSRRPPEDDADADEADESAPEPVKETAAERKARELGWHPKDEFLGPASKWVDAETFIKRGQDILPVLRDNNKRLLDRSEKQGSEIADLKKTLTEQTAALKELREMARNANQRGYDRALVDLKRDQREAVASGDTDRFEKVTEQIEETQKARAAVPVAEPSQSSQQPEAPSEVRAFIAANPWFNSDPVLNRAMQNEHVLLRQMDPNQSLEDNLADAKANVMSRFPERFGTAKANGVARPSQRQAAPVAQSSVRGSTAPPSKGKDPNRLESIEDPLDRAAAKVAFNRVKAAQPDFTEEEYMLSYNDPKRDILADLKAKREKRRAG